LKGHRDLRRVSLGAVICALVAVLVPLDPVRIVATLPLTLLLPGYAITAAAFGGRKIAGARMLLLSVAMSLAILAVGSVPLSAVGIYPGTWALLLGLVVLAGCEVAAIRRGKAPRRQRPRELSRLRRRDLGLLTGALVLGALAIALSQVPFAAKDAAGYTALWMLPGTGERSVEIGVQSGRQAAGRFRLEVESGSRGPMVSRSFRLEPGGETVLRVPVAAAANGRPVRVTATLYRAGSTDRPYRRVVSWVTGRARS
jgi:uncharacterized membrane protein